MLDRLVELLYRAHHNASCVMYEGGSEEEILEEEARYLLKYGAILPPCKVGDTLYILYGEPSYTIKEHEVSTILFGRTHDSIGLSNKSVFTVWEKRWYDYFGKTVFLTREEAEQALKGGHQ